MNGAFFFDSAGMFSHVRDRAGSRWSSLKKNIGRGVFRSIFQQGLEESVNTRIEDDRFKN